MFSQLGGKLRITRNALVNIDSILASATPKDVLSSSLHTSTSLNGTSGKRNWDLPTDHTAQSFFMKNNDKKYPPLQPGEKPRGAFVCNEKRNMDVPPKLLWYVCNLVRGLPIDDAINQLKFLHKRGASEVREVLLETQRMAVEEHNVEFPSNLWVSESFVIQDEIIKGFRRHSKMRFGTIRHRYSCYRCVLEEGPPPEVYYYANVGRKPEELLQDWMKGLKERKVLLNL